MDLTYSVHSQNTNIILQQLILDLPSLSTTSKGSKSVEALETRPSVSGEGLGVPSTSSVPVFCLAISSCVRNSVSVSTAWPYSRLHYMFITIQ